MRTLLRGIGGLRNDRQGVIALEYALMGSIIGVVLIAGFTAVWAPLNPAFAVIGNFLASTAVSGF